MYATTTVIRDDDNGKIVRVTDSMGAYYYVADRHGHRAAGGYSRREDADRAFVAPDGEYPPADVPIDGGGARLGTCRYCRRVVPLFDELPDPTAPDWEFREDEYYENADHDESCQWLISFGCPDGVACTPLGPPAVALTAQQSEGIWAHVGGFATEEEAIRAALSLAPFDVAWRDDHGTAVFGIDPHPETGRPRVRIEVYADGAHSVQ